MKYVIAALLLYAAHSYAGEVIDLGKVNVDGAARGPEVQMVGSDPVAKAGLRKVILEDLRHSETALLQELDNYTRKPGPKTGAKQ